MLSLKHFIIIQKMIITIKRKSFIRSLMKPKLRINTLFTRCL